MDLPGDMDPWDWSVDQVVENLCKKRTWWEDAVPNTPLPEEGSLETALRENETNGFTLLTYIDDQILKSDFGLKAVARRAAMRWAIGKLREKSSKYSQHLSSKRSVPQGESLAEHNMPKPSRQSNATDVRMQKETPTSLVASPSLAPPNAHGRRGETFIVDQQGKKRRKLVLGAANHESQDLSKFDFGKKLTADQIFYGTASFGDILKDDDDFSISQLSSPHPIAAAYVHHHLRRFISKPKREVWVRDNHHAIVVYPYEEDDQVTDQPRSVTLFAINGSEVQATREDASKIGRVGKSDEDEILPLYGDSDSEAEDQTSLIDEVEADLREDEALGISKHSPLATEVVSATIESTVKKLVESWQARKLPMRERTAQSIWRKAKCRSDRIHFVVQAQGVISHITRRLEKLKESLLAEPWHSKQDIRKQCAVLEESVFEIQEQSWRISVWKRTSEPPAGPKATTRKRTSRAPRKSPAAALNSDDAGDIVDSESDLEAGSDGLDQFIENDEEMTDYNPSSSQRLPPHLQSLTEDSGLRDDDDYDVLMGEADDEMDIDMRQESTCHEDFHAQLSADSSGVVSNRAISDPATEGSLANTAASETWASDMNLNRLSNAGSSLLPFAPRSRPVGPGDPLNQFTSLSDEALAKLPYSEVVTWDAAKLEERGDRKRLIVRIVRCRLSERQLDNMKRDVSLHDPNLWRKRVTDTASVLSSDRTTEDTSTEPWYISKDYLRLYVCWLKARASFWTQDVSITAKEVTIPVDERSFSACWKFLRNVINSDPTNDLAPTNYQSGIDHHAEIVSKRKRKVQKSVRGKEMRQDARERQEVQAEKERLLEARMGSLQPDAANGIVINIGKNDDQGDISMHPHIACRVKPHQISGVRFMWREIIEAKEGCLLAHTMGLGKTMQAITFLVAVTAAANSNDCSVASQIPDRLKVARYLIICPAALITNWLNELRQWIPPEIAQIVGTISSIEAETAREDRVTKVRAWHDRGGVMIMGYEMLNNLVKPPTRTSNIWDDQEREKFRGWLLEGPTIIIADEAHRIKTVTSISRQVFEKFSSPHRMALTGSPLANNLEEYWSMIDWVAPGYLGKQNEFKAYFVEPIQEGLYRGSSRNDHRRALKCLTVLKREIEPKVNRADITVLKDELKSKVEFLITVSLSKVQERAYKLCVSHMQKTDEADVSYAKLWHWMHILTVLCNHPTPFMKRIKEKAEGADGTKKRKKKKSVEYEPEIEDETDLQSQTLSPALIADAEKLFSNVPHLESSLWSWKTEILVQIINMAKIAADKVLIFSQSLPTLDYLEKFLTTDHPIRCTRLDGTTKMSNRPRLLNEFNQGNSDVFLMSTRAGGLGFNIPAANRVVLFDWGFNPQHEEQAIGRAYRIGQQKEVFVYRLCVGGTFEPKVWNKALFKAQLASRVVDAKNPERQAEKMSDYLFPPQPVAQEDLSQHRGKDPKVLDKLLDEMDKGKDMGIRAITTTETLMAEDQDADLDLAEMEEVEEMMKKNGGVRADNPATFGRKREIEEQQALLAEKARLEQARLFEESRLRQEQARANLQNPPLTTAAFPHQHQQTGPSRGQYAIGHTPQWQWQAPQVSGCRPPSASKAQMQQPLDIPLDPCRLQPIGQYHAQKAHLGYPSHSNNALYRHEPDMGLIRIVNGLPTKVPRPVVPSSERQATPIGYEPLCPPNFAPAQYGPPRVGSNSRRVHSQEPQGAPPAAKRTRKKRFTSSPPQVDTSLSGFTWKPSKPIIISDDEDDDLECMELPREVMQKCFGLPTAPASIGSSISLSAQASGSTSSGIVEHGADEVQMQTPDSPTTEPEVE